MSREFTEAERDMLEIVSTNVEDFHVEFRKEISQRKYAFEVKADATWYNWETEKVEDPVPEEFVGFWVMDSARCLQYDDFKECLKSDDWVKCTKEEVTTYEYVEIS